MTLKEFGEKYGLLLDVSDRAPKETGFWRFRAEFFGTYITDRMWMHIPAYGEGPTEEQALRRLADCISGQHLAYPKHINVPKLSGV